MLNYVMFMLNSNEPIKVAHLQKLANQSMLNGALVNISNKKKKKIDFTKHLTFLEVQKDTKVLNVSIRFHGEGSLF